MASLKSSVAGAALRTKLEQSNFHNSNVFNVMINYAVALLNPQDKIYAENFVL